MSTQTETFGFVALLIMLNILKNACCCMLFMLSVQLMILDPCLKNEILKIGNGQLEPSPHFQCDWSSVPNSSITPSMNTLSLMAR